MAAKTSPFLFGQDFTAKAAMTAPLDDAAEQARVAKLVADAEARGFEQGRKAGFSAAAESDASRNAAALERIGTLLLAAATRESDRAGVRREAIELATIFANKLAGRALGRFPLAEIEAMALRCFTEAHNAPHLAIRVHEAFVEAVKTRLTGLAADKGFAGKLVVLGDPEIAAGDARVEWADGGIVRERERIIQGIDEAVTAFFAATENGIEP